MRLPTAGRSCRTNTARPVVGGLPTPSPWASTRDGAAPVMTQTRRVAGPGPRGPAIGPATRPAAANRIARPGIACCRGGPTTSGCGGRRMPATDAARRVRWRLTRPEQLREQWRRRSRSAAESRWSRCPRPAPPRTVRPRLGGPPSAGRPARRPPVRRSTTRAGRTPARGGPRDPRGRDPEAAARSRAGDRAAPLHPVRPLRRPRAAAGRRLDARPAARPSRACPGQARRPRAGIGRSTDAGWSPAVPRSEGEAPAGLPADGVEVHMRRRWLRLAAPLLAAAPARIDGRFGGRRHGASGASGGRWDLLRAAVATARFHSTVRRPGPASRRLSRRRAAPRMHLVVRQHGRDGVPLAQRREPDHGPRPDQAPECWSTSPAADGKLHLVALEVRVVFKADWIAAHGDTTPSLFGEDFMDSGFPNR